LRREVEHDLSKMVGLVPQSEVLLQVLVVALNVPALMRGSDEVVQRRVGRQRRQPVLQGFVLIGGPFDKQPLFRLQSSAARVSSGVANPQCGEASAEGVVAAFTPADHLPRLLRQGLRQRLDADRL
jgi:hypothetical protein